MRMLGFIIHQIGHFAEHDAQEAAQLYTIAEIRATVRV